MLNPDILYQEMLNNAIKHGVQLKDNIFQKAKVRAMLNIPLTKCVCKPNDPEMYCISEKCLKKIQTDGECFCKTYGKLKK